MGCILGTSIRGLGIKHPLRLRFVKTIWGQTLGFSRPLVSNQTLTQRTSLIVREVTSKVQVAWGLGTGFPYFILGWKFVGDKPLLMHPQKNPGCTSRQTGCGRVALG